MRWHFPESIGGAPHFDRHWLVLRQIELRMTVHMSFVCRWLLGDTLPRPGR
jgi:hypothetical protein